MNVEGAWELNITGRGAVVSILDDGIEYTHPDLKDNYVSVCCVAVRVCSYAFCCRILWQVTTLMIMTMILCHVTILPMRINTAQGVLVR